ncbi:hypothetical protein SPRG_09896 [Saprolegnia parasitica CBS 223.65]|uniref:Uncharacterized protein n=1 Tax=Saprolegnia parasitica (strain CBS 223.65) TaxID=695850 RepID=A0A067C561_SAPPC|nr:hypothetical protein SPRG_09896 [Saprolegnia parasitica CBS 223.65]KDO24260.1 hypothetical protein SPRG_09896 [Saprolegnia parasitica CBS 223.65]|eukprot:XP_012205032.1 hypothetical protein SPRG_09896 [Saprolegnia parasitica CBS 223.65]
MTDDEVLAKDRAEHPECTYATSLSTACRSVNGDRTCETIRKIFRCCPGKPKELIINSSTKEEGAEDNDAVADDPFRHFGPRRRDGPASSMGDDPFEAMDGLFRGMMGGPFGGTFGGFDQMPRPPQHETPPHHGYERPRAPRRQAPPQKDVFDGFDGRVEEI